MRKTKTIYAELLFFGINPLLINLILFFKLPILKIMKNKLKLLLFVSIFFISHLSFAAEKNTNINIDESVKKVIKKMKGATIPFLIEEIKNGKKPVKIEAITQLGDLKAKESVEFLTGVMTYVIDPTLYDEKFLGDKKTTPEFDQDVRAEAALSLGKINDENSLKDIGNTLIAERNTKVKIYCAKALGLMKNEKGNEYFDKYLTFELQWDKRKINNEVVKEIARAMGSIGHKSAFFKLVEITQSDNLEYETKKEALKALEKIKLE